MEHNGFDAKINTAPRSSVQQFLVQVYGWMFAGLGITGITAWYTADSGLVFSILENGLMWPLIIANIALVFGISRFIEKISAFTAQLLFILYSFMTGLFFSSILLVYTGESIYSTFLICSSMFAALSAYGFFTKKDLSGMGSFMTMGLFGLVIAIVVNMFLASSFMGFLISIVGVIVFAGLTAYDTQKIKDMHTLQEQGAEVATKGAILGALHLYLDFINLFLFLLRFLGNRD